MRWSRPGAVSVCHDSRARSLASSIFPLASCFARSVACSAALFCFSFSGLLTRRTTSAVPGETVVLIGSCLPSGNVTVSNFTSYLWNGEKLPLAYASARFAPGTPSTFITCPVTTLPAGITAWSNAYTVSTTLPCTASPGRPMRTRSSSTMRSGVPLGMVSSIFAGRGTARAATSSLEAVGGTQVAGSASSRGSSVQEPPATLAAAAGAGSRP